MGIGYGNPWLTLGYILLAGGFVYGVLRPKTRVAWRSMGVAQAFVVALYAEMYGLPLSLYVIAGITGQSEYAADHFHGHAWAYLFGWGDSGAVVLTWLGNLLIFTGGVIALAGWRQIHRARGGFVTEGLYRRIRHPQYTGFFLFLAGSLINWPTFPTLLMFPVLLWLYQRLARQEEAEAERTFGALYAEYRQRTGRFAPLWSR